MDRGIQAEQSEPMATTSTPGSMLQRNEQRRASDLKIAELVQTLRESTVAPPTLGRIVHYIQCAGDPPAKHRVAAVVGDHGTLVADLWVFPKSIHAGFTVDGVSFDAEAKRAGSWHWPERS